MAKQSVTQRSFLLGETREGFLEGGDLEIRQNSVRRGLNARVTATRTLKVRPGTRYVRTLVDAVDLIEIRPDSDSVFGLLINDSSLEVIDESGSLIFRVAAVPWESGADVWAETFRKDTIIGGAFGLYELTVEDGTWTFARFKFDIAANGDMAQPYWSFRQDLTMRPSARSGAITLTASGAIWTPAYVGQRVRYGQREIEITAYVSPTVVRGQVLSDLPPSFRVRLKAPPSGFRVGDTVVAQDTNFQGLISAIGNDGGEDYLDVITTSYFGGPAGDEKISGPSATVEIRGAASIAPLASPIWDEPLMSPIRGYPRAGASAAGRLTLIDFPQVPDLVCMSSTRGIRDFQTGTRDDDGVARQVGDNTPRFLHIVNAGDLILFSDRGLYFLSLRTGDILTPSNFNIVQFDKRGANDVRPAAVDDGVVFVESSGASIAACILTGEASLRWSVRTISNYHSHLIRTPVKVCGPSLFAQAPEKYLFVVNSDGTMAAVSWFADFQADSVGFLPWETRGAFRTMSPIFGGYWAIVERTISGKAVRFLENLDDAAPVDCASPILGTQRLAANGADLTVNGAPLLVGSSAATPLIGATVRVTGGGWDGGLRTVAADGTVPDVADMPEGSDAGLDFELRIEPWPVDQVENPRGGMLPARLIRGSVSVLHSGGFDVRANRMMRSFGGYRIGADLTQPPPPRTEVCKFSVIGRRDHPEIEIIRSAPTALEVLAISQEVQV